MANISVTLDLAVPDSLCRDFLTACFEGGSAYWLACDSVERDTGDSNVIKIVGCYDREDESEKWGDATLETMREGIRRVLSGEVKINTLDYTHILRVVVDPDATGWDANTADCVLQAGLLNGLVYG